MSLRVERFRVKLPPVNETKDASEPASPPSFSAHLRFIIDKDEVFLPAKSAYTEADVIRAAQVVYELATKAKSRGATT